MLHNGEIVSPGFPSVRPCQVTIEDFFLLTSGCLVYGIEILSFPSAPSFVMFSALFHALSLATHLLTFPIRKVRNLGDGYQFLTLTEEVARR